MLIGIGWKYKTLSILRCIMINFDSQCKPLSTLFFSKRNIGKTSFINEFCFKTKNAYNNCAVE